MSLYGVEPWVRNADGFGVLFGLIGSLSPLGRAGTGRSCCACPVTGAARLTPVAGTVALLVISIGSTAFDGAKEGALFNGLAQDLQSVFRSIGFSIGRAFELGFVVGLAGAVAIVGAIWGLGMARDGAPGRRADRRALARAFAHTLIPIAAGYVVAHYFSLLAYNGQELWRLANDPLGNGSDLFGGGGAGIDYGVVSRDRHLVRAGRRAGRRPRRGARAGARPRARALRLRPRGDPLAGCHADPDGGVHVPRPVAALGGAGRMTWSPTPVTGSRSCSTWRRSSR